MKALLFLTLVFSALATAQNCPTDSLKPLVGNYLGVASIVTFDSGKFALQRPKRFAPKSIHNESTFRLDDSDSCHKFHVKIDYLNPKWVETLTGRRVVREVQFDGQALDKEGQFTLATAGVLQGNLRVIDEKTFMATFDAPNPLNPQQITSCKEFISLTLDGKHIIRTIQCFDKKTGEFVQDRLTMEDFN
jgi:hypothetical protein